MSVYLALLRRRGARALALACTLGWLGFASFGLAIVLLVSHRTGSFAAAGAAVAAFGAGAGLLAPFRGRLVDTRGAPVLIAFGALHTAGLLSLLVVPRGPATVAAAGVAGAVAPPLIATARAVWPAVSGPELTRAAHALNALLGDAGAVLGPAATGALAATLGPPAALALLAPGPFAGCLIVARLGVPRHAAVPHDAAAARAAAEAVPGPAATVPADASHDPAATAAAEAVPGPAATVPADAAHDPAATAAAEAVPGPAATVPADAAHDPAATAAAEAVPGPAAADGPAAAAAAGGALGALRASVGLRTLVLVDVWLGAAVGALDVAAPALAADEGAPELAAIPLAAFAAGSVVSSLWAGQSTAGADRRFVAGSALLSLALAGCALVSTVFALALVLVAAGVAYGVLNVGVFELLDVVVPRRRAVEALTWLTTAGGLGIAVGAAVAGSLAADSPRSALLLAAFVTVPGAVLAVARRRTLAPA